MSNQDWVGIVALAIVFAVVVLAVWALGKLFRWFKKPDPEPKKSTVSWVWVFLIAVVALITYVLNPRRPGRAPAPEPATNWVALVFFLVMIPGTIVLWIGYLFYLQYDRAASRALKRGQSGDTEGAIAELRAAIEESKRSEVGRDESETSRNPYAAPSPRRKRSPIRSNAMGLLHFMREEWPEAYQWFLEAEQIGGRQAHTLGNQGLALWKMGRADEAAAILAEACSLAPDDLLQPCNLGLVLIDLGRIDEAHEQLAKAEANLKKTLSFTASSRKALRAQVDELRKKLASVPEDRDRAVFDQA